MKSIEISRLFFALNFQPNDVLNEGGILLHSFWHGQKERFIEYLRFIYCQQSELIAMAEKEFEVLKCEKYTELKTDDSFFVV